MMTWRGQGQGAELATDEGMIKFRVLAHTSEREGSIALTPLSMVDENSLCRTMQRRLILTSCVVAEVEE